MNSILIILSFITTLNVAGSKPIIKSNKEINEKCLKCHSLSTLGYRDESSGLIINLSVNPKEFYKSNHKNLECIECHSKDFQTFPHPEKLKHENLYCLDCHKDEKEFSKFHFNSIESDFKNSIHYKLLNNKFNCFSCHDPHSFRINARVNQNIAETVLYDNRICLQCHNNETSIYNLSGKYLPSLNEVHTWLPHKDLHWANVRCIDCHTIPTKAGVSHLILPKEEALQNCVKCHSTNSILLQSLYKFQSKQARNKEGFINAVIFNNSYVIGATRNYYLNLLSFMIFGAVIIALSVHAILRWRSTKRNVEDEQS